MKNWAAVTVVVLCITGLMEFASADITWQEIGRENLDIYSVLTHLQNPDIIYMGTENNVLKSTDGGEIWRSVLLVRGTNGIVNYLAFDLKNTDIVYAATGNGLFRSRNQGKSWNKIYKGKDYLTSDCTALAVVVQRLLLGTKAGLFISIDSGRTWHKERGDLGEADIFTIKCDKNEPAKAYISTSRGVYKSADSGKSWEKIFVTLNALEDSRYGEESEGSEEPEPYSYMPLSLNPELPENIYLAVNNTINESKDAGSSWEPMSQSGLLGSKINHILVSQESRVYAATDSGVFFYENGLWQDLSSGLGANKVRFLTIDKRDSIYAATDGGLFKTIKTSYNNRQDELISLYYNNEPDILNLQQAAIKYAELEPEKIITWRKKAAKSAWLPKVGVSVDSDAADLWHWESGSTTKEGDDTLVRGKAAVEWGVSLSWDLGNLLWNDDQTSIDVRSRLMVQLRDDILDKVTKLYFERIRVKRELEMIPPDQTSRLFEKKLKLEELAASLDALTGGYFSRSIESHKGRSG